MTFLLFFASGEATISHRLGSIFETDMARRRILRATRGNARAYNQVCRLQNKVGSRDHCTGRDCATEMIRTRDAVGMGYKDSLVSA